MLQCPVHPHTLWPHIVLPSKASTNNLLQLQSTHGTAEQRVRQRERGDWDKAKKERQPGQSGSKNITRVKIVWTSQGLETLLFCKTTHTGSDSWLQLFEKQGTRRNHNSLCMCVCVYFQDKWVPGPFSVWEHSFPPCSLTQSLVLTEAKPQPSSYLSFVSFSSFAQAEESDTILETNCQLLNNQTLHLFVRLTLK